MNPILSLIIFVLDVRIECFYRLGAYLVACAWYLQYMYFKLGFHCGSSLTVSYAHVYKCLQDFCIFLAFCCGFPQAN
jgi:hypothetical protein